MMWNYLQNTLIAVLVLMVIFCLSLVPYSMGQRSGYRTGQIDALNGKIYYRLERQEDGEFRWVECPDVCKYEKKGE